MPELQSADSYSGELATLSKSLFGAVLRNERLLASEQPVYDHRELQLQGDGILLRNPARPTFEMLRSVSYRTSLIGAIHQVRVYDWSPYSDPFGDNQGLGVRLEDRSAEPTAADERTFAEARDFLKFMGDRSPGWTGRAGLKQCFQMMLRDSLTLDRNAFYLIKNRRGRVSEIRYIDPGTIYEIDPHKGYRGDTNITHVQIVNNEITHKFSRDELLLFHHNHLSDVYYSDGGYSPTESCLLDLVAVIRALRYNRQRFSNNPPKGALLIKGAVTTETLNSVHEQLQAMFAGGQNGHEIPILGGDSEVSWMDLGLKSDMEFVQLIQWETTMCLAAHSMDQAELGMRLYSGSTMSEPNPDGRIFAASQRAKRAQLAYFADIFNVLKQFMPEFDRITYYFYGIEPDDADDRIDRAEKETRSVKLVDQVRRENDLPTIGEEMRELYELTDQEFEAVRFAGAYINNNNHLQHTGPMLSELRPAPTGQEPLFAPSEGEPTDAGDAAAETEKLSEDDG